MLARLRTFFTSNEKVLTGLAAIATVLALVATVAALVFAGRQIELARKTVEAQTVYQLQKDGRDLLKSLFQNDPPVFDFVFGSGSGNQAVAARSDLALTEMIQYFSSVMNQRRDGVIGDMYWTTFDAEMCSIIRRPKVAEFWDRKVRKGTYSDDFKKWGDECLKRPATP